MTRSGDELTDRGRGRGRCKTANAMPLKLRNSRSASLAVLSPLRPPRRDSDSTCSCRGPPRETDGRRRRRMSRRPSLAARAPGLPIPTTTTVTARARVASTAAAAWLLRQISPPLSPGSPPDGERERERESGHADRQSRPNASELAFVASLPVRR